jgi:hypothetical protein
MKQLFCKVKHSEIVPYFLFWVFFFLRVVFKMSENVKLLSTKFVCETRPILLGGNWEEFQYLRPSVRSFCLLFVNFTSKEIKTLIWCQFRRTVDILLDKTTYRKFAIFDILVKCQLFKTLFPGYWNFFSDFKNLSYRCLSNLTLIEKNFYFATFFI